MNDNLNERKSAPTGVNESENENKLNSNDLLGDAACSASSLDNVLDALSHQQELPIESLMSKSPNQEEVLKEMTKRLLSLKGSINSYFEQSKAPLS